MIVPMKHITLLCVASAREATLECLRGLGVMHLNLDASDSEQFRRAQVKLALAQHALQILKDTQAGKQVQPTTVGPHKAHGHEMSLEDVLRAPLPVFAAEAAAKIGQIRHFAEMRQLLVNEAEHLDRDIALYLPFGDFDVALPARLTGQGMPVKIFRAPVNTTFIERDGVLVEEFGADQDFTYGVMIGPGDLPADCEEVSPPQAPVSVLQARQAETLARIEQINGRLRHAAENTEDLARELVRLTDMRDFANAADTMQPSGAVAWITGWIPADRVDILRDAAEAHAWGLLLRDPESDERPPTLLSPPRLFRPVLALFDALGIAPAYNETDISVPFFCFFSIFFAMLVGDGGYGALIFLLTLRMRRKMSQAPRAPFVLLYFFAFATVVWGCLSNTWFGTHPKFADNAASLWLNDPEHGINNMMLFCFTLGVIHLSVARIWNAAKLFPDSKFLAQVGWLGVIWFMYCMSCSIVGIFQAPPFIYPVFGVSVLLLFFFTLKRSELRTSGIELGMLPLNIVSALGDIISYVRLFAVGLASVKVAENFNDMAVNNGLPLWAKIIPMVLILLIGHGLNFAMAGLSILVHAVRLNTLEFSNHKGITWSGYAYRPFKRKADAT